MVVQHNLQAMNSNRMLNVNVADRKKVTEKLSSGYGVNRAADDAAGLAISEKMRRQIRGLTQATANAQDGISCLQIAEGALHEVHDMIQRMNELCVKAANATLDQTDRNYIQSEIRALNDEIDRTGATTTFNEIKLLNGLRQETVTANPPVVTGLNNMSLTQPTTDTDAVFSFDPLQDGDVVGIQNNSGDMVYYKVSNEVNNNDGSNDTVPISATKESIYDRIATGIINQNPSTADYSTWVSWKPYGSGEGKYNFGHHGPLKLTLQVGAEYGDEMELTINPINSSRIGVFDIDVSDRTGDGGRAGIDKCKRALEVISRERSELGAYQNRLEHTVKNLDNVVENTTAAESRIRDADMADLMVVYSNRNILIQAGQSVLSQANQSNQGVLSLLG
ncbi:MAG: flagellin [Lachnospiraceae bacterium]|nr:flagellin [Lachnospiraceae bacterium]